VGWGDPLLNGAQILFDYLLQPQIKMVLIAQIQKRSLSNSYRVEIRQQANLASCRGDSSRLDGAAI
jgi:hypothetical protein